MKPLALAVAGMLAGMFCGCAYNPLNQTPIKVRIVVVWTQADFDKAIGGNGVTYPHTVVERIDTGERIMIQRDTWGKTNDVFTIKACNLHW